MKFDFTGNNSKILFTKAMTIIAVLYAITAPVFLIMLVCCTDTILISESKQTVIHCIKQLLNILIYFPAPILYRIEINTRGSLVE